MEDKVTDEDFAVVMLALFGPHLGSGYCPE
jgi:hypothetical protein